jgi:hypothetical protein
LLWCFGVCTLRAVEPLCAGHIYDLRDLAAHNCCTIVPPFIKGE